MPKGARGDPMPREWHLAYNREYYARPEVKAHRAEKAREAAHDPTQRGKWLARRKTQRAVVTGRLVKQPCAVCGATKVEAHHDDYAKPLEVRWLCHTHHRQHHGTQAKGAK